MKTLNLEIKNPEPIVKELKALLSDLSHTQNVYLKLPDQQDYENPLNLTSRKNAMGMEEYLLPEILHAFGIRSITLTEPHDLKELISLTAVIFESKDYKRKELFKNEPLVNALQQLFGKSRTIAFDDWAGFNAASELWQLLLNDIIEPLAKKDLEFIFYLGDTAEKLSFQVDEALEIMSEFSKRGSVTLALDESEALNLWRILNGVKPDIVLESQTIADLKKKYFSIFSIVNISRLLIYSTNSAMLFSADEQFVLSRKTVDTKVELGNNARQNFISGYSAGLLIANGISQSIALGLIIFGASGVYNSTPDIAAVQSYINDWVADFDKPDAIFLYQ